MITDSLTLAKEIRKNAVSMVYRAKASHIGGALSMSDILAVLYSSVLHYDAQNPQWTNRDRFILSKGHACVSFYATLALCDFFPLSKLQEYGQEGSLFLSHSSHFIPGVEISSGSLGHGLPVATGIAIAAKHQHKDYRVYALIGDGELNEGSNWEALLLGAGQQLDNLCLVIDYNKLQGFGSTNNILPLNPLAAKLESFNWHTIEVDGHNHDELKHAFSEAQETRHKPTVIIANTIKGKGVSFMENELLWHYHSPNDAEYQQAIKEIEQ